jgi:hypothetical protein
METLLELSRFITLVLLTQTQIARHQSDRPWADSLSQLWTVMHKLDIQTYQLAQQEAEAFDATITSPFLTLGYKHFDGIIQISWQLAEMARNILFQDQAINCFKLGLEIFVCFAKISPVSKVSFDGEAFGASARFHEFLIQMLFHPLENIRSWTCTFFPVLYTSRYLEPPDDPQGNFIYYHGGFFSAHPKEGSNRYFLAH